MLELLPYLPDLGITELRAVIKLVMDTHAVDLGNMSLVSLKYRIEKHMYKNGIKHFEIFMQRLLDSHDAGLELLKDIEVPSTEMFRDPSLWRSLRDNVLPKDAKTANAFKVLIPQAVSGDELFTLAIILCEKKLAQIELTVTCLQENIVEEIENVACDIKKMEISEQNYQRYAGQAKFIDYFALRDKQYYKMASILPSVKVIKQSIFFEPVQETFNLILYRNKCIYLGSMFKDTIIQRLDACLGKGGFLVLGGQENLDGVQVKEKYTRIDKNESIYQKRS